MFYVKILPGNCMKELSSNNIKVLYIYICNVPLTITSYYSSHTPLLKIFTSAMCVLPDFSLQTALKTQYSFSISYTLYHSAVYFCHSPIQYTRLSYFCCSDNRSFPILMGILIVSETMLPGISWNKPKVIQRFAQVQIYTDNLRKYDLSHTCTKDGRQPLQDSNGPRSLV